MPAAAAAAAGSGNEYFYTLLKERERESCDLRRVEHIIHSIRQTDSHHVAFRFLY
jgi:hypothetical protein